MFTGRLCQVLAYGIQAMPKGGVVRITCPISKYGRNHIFEIGTTRHLESRVMTDIEKC